VRCNNIEIKLKIPIPINEPDGNGNIYAEDAIAKACADVEDLPIIQYNSEGKEIPIGVVTNASYSQGYICAEGIICNGGTGEIAYLYDRIKTDKVITKIKFTHFGFCE